MKKWVFLLLIVSSVCGFGQTKYILLPHVTFGTVSGNFFSDGYRFLTGNCNNMRFNSFDIYKEEETHILHPFGNIYKTGKWTRGYKFVQDSISVSLHQARFNMGSLFDSMKDFVVQDGMGNSLGKISGNFFTNCAAEFYFYDNLGKPFAIAELDPSFSVLTVSAMDGTVNYVGEKTFHFQRNRSDLLTLLSLQEPDDLPTNYYWTIEECDESSIDPRFFWPFISFICEVWWAGQT